jgi:hypothetical protein
MPDQIKGNIDGPPDVSVGSQAQGYGELRADAVGGLLFEDREAFVEAHEKPEPESLAETDKEAMVTATSAGREDGGQPGPATAISAEKVYDELVKLSRQQAKQEKRLRKIDKEQLRMAAQQQTMAAEQQRMAAEQQTMAAEQQTMAAEQQRMAAQQQTMAAEQLRMAAEQLRMAAQQQTLAVRFKYLLWICGSTLTAIIAVVGILLAVMSSRISSVETNLSSRISSVETNLSSRISSVETNFSSRISSVETTMSKNKDDLSEKITQIRVDIGKLQTTLDERRIFSNSLPASGANSELAPAPEVPVVSGGTPDNSGQVPAVRSTEPGSR